MRLYIESNCIGIVFIMWRHCYSFFAGGITIILYMCNNTLLLPNTLMNIETFVNKGNNCKPNYIVHFIEKKPHFSNFNFYI